MDVYGAAGYGRYVGRVGALAVALGIGAAIVSSPGAAWATPDTGTDSSTTSPDGTAPGTTVGGEGAAPATDPTPPAVSGATTGTGGGDEDTTPTEPTKVSTSPSETTTEVGDGVVISNSGGAHHTSRTKSKANKDSATTTTAKDTAVPKASVSSSTVSKKTPAANKPAPAAPAAAVQALSAAAPADDLTVSAAAAAPHPVPSLVVAPVAAFAAVLTTLFGGNAPDGATDSPLGWVMLAAARRQTGSTEDTQRTLAAPAAEVMTSQAVAAATVNLPPTPTNPVIIGTPDSATGAVTGTLNYADPEGKAVKYTVTGQPSGGNLTLDAKTGAFTYTPTAASRLEAGITPALDVDSFTVTVSDGTTANNTAVAVGVQISPTFVTTSPPSTTVAGGVSAVAVGKNKVYVTDKTAGTVTVIDANTHTVIGSPINLGSNAQPTAVVVNGAGTKVYVANSGNGTVSVIDTVNGNAVTNIAVAGSPTGIALSPDGKTVYVTNAADGTVAKISTSTQKVTGTVKNVGTGLGVVAVSRDSKTIFVSTSTGVAYFTSTSTSVKTIPIAGAPTTAVVPGVTSNVAYVVGLNGVVSLIDTKTPTVVTPITDTNFSGNWSAAINPDGSVLTVANGGQYVTFIDTKSKTVISNFDTDPATGIPGDPGDGDPPQPPLGSVPRPAIAFNSTGSTLYVTDPAGIVRAVSLATTVAGNALPVVQTDGFDQDPDTGVFTGNFTATDSDPVRYTVTESPTKGTIVITSAPGDPITFAYTPTAKARHDAATGSPDLTTDTFSIAVTDSKGAVSTVQLQFNVLPTNTDPVITTQTQKPPSTSTGKATGTVKATDADGDKITYGGMTTTKGTVVVTSTGAWTYTPTAQARHDAAGSSGTTTDTFTITITDGHGGTATQDFTVAVTPANSALTAKATVGKPDPLSGIATGVITVTDKDGDTPNFTNTAATKGDVTLNQDGTFSYTPTPAARAAARTTSATDTDAFTVTVSDGYGSSKAVNVTVEIAPTDTAPTAGTPNVGTPSVSTGVVKGTLSGTDPDGDKLTFSGSQATALGRVTVTSAGAFTYTPTATARHAAATGDPAAQTDTFTATVTDEYGATDTVEVTVSVQPRNANPASGKATVEQPNSVTGVVTGTVSATDADRDTLTYSSTGTSAKGGTVTVTSNGAFTYTPSDTARQAAAAAGAPAAAKTDTFTFTAIDGHGGTGTFTVTVKVAPAVPSNNPSSVSGPAQGTVVIGTTGAKYQIFANLVNGQPSGTTVQVISPTGTVNTVQVSGTAGAAPIAMPNGNVLLVTTDLATNTYAVVITPTSQTFTSTLSNQQPLGTPHVTSNGTIYVTTSQPNAMSTRTITRLTQASAGGVPAVLSSTFTGTNVNYAWDDANNTAYASYQTGGDNEVLVVKSTGAAITTDPIAGNPAGPITAGANGTAYLTTTDGTSTTVHVIKATDGSVVDHEFIGTPVGHVTVAPSGTAYQVHEVVNSGMTTTYVSTFAASSTGFTRLAAGDATSPGFTGVASGGVDAIKVAADGTGYLLVTNGAAQQLVVVPPSGVGDAIAVDLTTTGQTSDDVYISPDNKAYVRGASLITEVTPAGIATPHDLSGATSVGLPIVFSSTGSAAYAAVQDSNGDVYLRNILSNTDSQHITGGFVISPIPTVTQIAVGPDGTAYLFGGGLTGGLPTRQTVVALGSDGTKSTPYTISASGGIDIVQATSITFGPGNTAYLTVASIDQLDENNQPRTTFTGNVQILSLSKSVTTVYATRSGFTSGPVTAASDGKLYLTVLTFTGPGQYQSQVNVITGPENSGPVGGGFTVQPPTSTGAVVGAVTATDPNGDPLTYSSGTQVTSKGSVTVASDGTFTYTPTPAARHAASVTGAPASTDTFNVTVGDSHGATLAVAVTVTVSPANSAPVVNSAAGTPDPLTGAVTGAVTSTDADGDTRTYSGPTTSDKGGMVTVNADGTFTYAPSESARTAANSGTASDLSDTFTVTVDDGHVGGATPVVVTISVAPQPTTPYAVDGTAPGPVVIGSTGAKFIVITSDNQTRVQVVKPDGRVTTTGPIAGVPIGNAIATTDGGVYLATMNAGTPQWNRVSVISATGVVSTTEQFNGGTSATFSVGPDGRGYLVVDQQVPVSHTSDVTVRVFHPDLAPGAAQTITFTTDQASVGTLQFAPDGTGYLAYTAQPLPNYQGGIKVFRTDGTVGTVTNFPGIQTVTNDGLYTLTGINDFNPVAKAWFLGADTLQVTSADIPGRPLSIKFSVAPNGVAQALSFDATYLGSPANQGWITTITPAGVITTTDPILGNAQAAGNDLVVAPNGTAYKVIGDVASGETQVVAIVSPTGVLTTVPIAGAQVYGVSVAPNGNAYLVRINDFVVVTSAGDTAVAPLNLPPGIGLADRALTFTPDGTAAYALGQKVSNGEFVLVNVLTGDATTATAPNPNIDTIFLSNDPKPTLGADGTAYLKVPYTDGSFTYLVLAKSGASDGYSQTGPATDLGLILGNDGAAYVTVVTGGTTKVVKLMPSGETVVGSYSGVAPGAAVIGSGGKLYVAVNDASSGTAVLKVIVPPAEASVLQTISGPSAVDIAVSPDGTRLYTSKSVIDLGSGVVTPLPLAGSPFSWGVAVSPNGTRAYVTDLSAGTVTIVDTTTNSAIGDPISLGGSFSQPLSVAVSHDGTRAYATSLGNGTVTVIDTSNNQVVGTPINAGVFVFSVAVSPDGSRVYAGGLSGVVTINTATNTVVGTPIAIDDNTGAFLRSVPGDIVVSADGSHLYTANFLNDSNAGTVTTSVSVIDVSNHSVVNIPLVTVAADNFASAQFPPSLALGNDGTRIYVTNHENNTLTIINTATKQVVDVINIGGDPYGIAISPDGTKAYVANSAAGGGVTVIGLGSLAV